MGDTSERTVSEPATFVFDEQVDTVTVKIVNGEVNVVGSEGPSARVEITEVDGPPLKVSLKGGRLTVGYEDLRWNGFLKITRKSWRRRAVVSLTVPQRTAVEVATVGAGAVVSGVSGSTSVQGVGGDTTLVGLSGKVRAQTVSGSVEAQSLSGDLHFSTVSGDLTVVDGTSSAVKGDSVSGNMVLDLGTVPGGDVRLNTVSGEIALRLPEHGDAEVDASTTSGRVSCAFDELRVDGGWGAKRVSGRIGGRIDGGTRLRATTVSGAIAVLRRPSLDDSGHGTPGGAPETGASGLRKES
ncbi:DUF4097 family beta strand repeat-containing protein [Actinacidiphila yeochonensis]|uniref:DUF4097 family beta strand repeat-containing protein n=1 Tax=Actinacidiphila yeochonensis TaxID=89050 RepID=UPI00068FD41A|nr:DUF4097 family beta strand repeat-containing protein [Actinacidiphila yeochonensis]